MIRKLVCAAALFFGIGVAASAPAIDFICSCNLCTTANSSLACRDLPHGSAGFISCGDYHKKYC